MIFTDVLFFVFFAVVFAGYWSMSANEWRKAWLLAASAVFYAVWDWRFLGLALFVICNTYVVTRLMAVELAPRLRRHILIAGITLSLAVLAVFKYLDFFATNVATLLGISPRLFDLVLPLGISFYTFHSISYMVDAYHRRLAPARNFVDVALYILFFPQLVAGPIVRAPDLLPQMRSARTWQDVEAKYFLLLFLIGYFKKTVISDNLVRFIDPFFAHPQNFGGGDAMIAVLSYAVQIYCDFSGYTDMAIATAGLLGYRLRPNFDHPYLAANLIEFWRRWHISLSSWLRDYLYIPLGGNRGGLWAHTRNIMITMLLGGLWHGAAWTFVFWGALHGAGLVACRAWIRLREHYGAPAPRYSVLGNAITFLWVALAWIFFRSSSFDTAMTVIHSLAVSAPPTMVSASVAAAVATALLAAHVTFYRLDLTSLVARVESNIFGFAYGAMVALILPFINVRVTPFIYFQF